MERNIKIGMLGDNGVGKSSLMSTYVESSFDEDYISTLGVNFMEKKVKISSDVTITYSIWDISPVHEELLPLGVNEAEAIFFVFDLVRSSTLIAIREFYKKALKYNKNFSPFLIGNKFDIFAETMSPEAQESITTKARLYANAMKGSLVFVSNSQYINLNQLFQLVAAKSLGLKIDLPKITPIGEPIFEYSEVQKKKFI